MNKFNDLVKDDGSLNDNKIVRREIVYTGMNGKSIERFFLSPNESYIFKPLTNNEQWGKEKWVYENVLYNFPSFYPRIITSSSSEDVQQNWIIFEDLGFLSHSFTEEIAVQVTKKIAWWHNQPTEHLMNASLNGPKPFIEEIIIDLINRKTEAVAILSSLSFTRNTIDNIYTIIETVKFPTTLVLSHGDLHAGNFAMSTLKGSLYILDWEHVHLNSPYWDLYHLIDLSHPLFPKTVTNELRMKILDCYVNEVVTTGQFMNKDKFIEDYYMFSIIFSLWMILLIYGDIKGDSKLWPMDKLILQLEETKTHFTQCITQLNL